MSAMGQKTFEHPHRIRPLCARTGRLPQAKRLVPEDPKQLAIFAITPVAISLVDYACGYGKSFLVEL